MLFPHQWAAQLLQRSLLRSKGDRQDACQRMSCPKRCDCSGLMPKSPRQWVSSHLQSKETLSTDTPSQRCFIASCDVISCQHQMPRLPRTPDPLHVNNALGACARQLAKCRTTEMLVVRGHTPHAMTISATALLVRLWRASRSTMEASLGIMSRPSSRGLASCWMRKRCRSSRVLLESVLRHCSPSPWGHLRAILARQVIKC
mmetsp:Transcript_43334/g.86688  ORF Transcript_43334/g.86688 Transcript_43334/m.86688 type:complete len:202 (+) Transcript_43334:111-716(+)